MVTTRDLFRKNLRAIISARGIKQDKAAEDIGISKSFLTQLLAGTSAFSPETIDKICTGLKCSPSELFVTDTSAVAVPEAAKISELTVEELKAALYINTKRDPLFDALDRVAGAGAREALLQAIQAAPNAIRAALSPFLAVSPTDALTKTHTSKTQAQPRSSAKKTYGA